MRQTEKHRSTLIQLFIHLFLTFLVLGAIAMTLTSQSYFWFEQVFYLTPDV